ncbi:MAG: S8 family serine peptidase, partial [Rhodospirillales bacterium]|nr:S8 family serine peptidase [Rhodospirillales bacterium]
YVADLHELGLSVIDITHLEGLGSKLYHLKIDDGAHPFHARHLHGKKYPGVAADIHHHFEQHARKRKKRRQKAHPSRRLTSWGRAKPGCGKGIRIGVVDGGVDTKHAAFKGRKLKFRSFHLKGQTPGAFPHGTAAASILIGAGQFGGLLPEAQVFAGNVFHKRGSGKPRASARSILMAVSWLVKQRSR